jgi:hypothetical protein
VKKYIEKFDGREESKQRKGRRGKKKEREKRRERGNKEGTLYVCAFAHRRRYFYWGKFNNFLI